jgi:cation diffusion facilitator family transporter
MFFSAVVNFFVSRKLYKVAKETNSIALEADALHLKADVYTSLGVGFGILLIWISGINILDPIIAIAVAVFILQEAYKLIIKAFDPLLDSRVEQVEIDKFCEIIRLNLPENTAIHDLRVRQNGSVYILDFALQVPPNMIVQDAHSICDLLEKKIRFVYADADINIHIEPKIG